MLWLFIGLGAAGIAIVGWLAWRRHLRRRVASEQLESLRAMAADDVARFGEQFRALPVSRAADYQAAEQSYTAALAALRIPAATAMVTQSLADAQYAVLRHTSSLAGNPPPERRLPCFFNPQHGPSLTDVVWTEPGHGTRKLPACADDATRIEADFDPDIRHIPHGTHHIPYWNAGPAFAPYGAGYFSRAPHPFPNTNFSPQDTHPYGDPRHRTGRSPYPLEPPQ